MKLPAVRARKRTRTALACAGAAVTTAIVAPSAGADGAEDWEITPGRGSKIVATAGDAWKLLDTVRAGSSGQQLAAHTVDTRHFDSAVNTIAAEVDATIPDGSVAAVDVRGLRADGTWTEWTEVRPDEPAVLGEATETVQTRLFLSKERATASPQVRELDMSASRTDAKPTAAAATNGTIGPTFNVYATREGLVGGTTANGHKIKSRDHFVAFPSRKALSNKNSGDHTVRVCRTNWAHCEWAPVYDVGPWNTKDDYWNPASERQMWKDLPRYKPEAQAAYREGYNGGRDEFGRRVGNPAGIDLADGTFWDGVKMKDNGTVKVSLQWQATGPWGTVVTSSAGTYVRSGRTTSNPKTGYAAKHARPRLLCWTEGQQLTGSQGRSNRWFKVTNGKWVSASNIKVGSAGWPAHC